MIREVGDDVAIANFYQAVLHKFGLDEKIGIDALELRDQRAAHQPVEIRAGDQSHGRITSSTGVNGRLNAPARPVGVTATRFSSVLISLGTPTITRSSYAKAYGQSTRLEDVRGKE